MKHLVFAGVALAGLVAVAEAPREYDHYREWKLVEEEVKSPKPLDFVRAPQDLTPPLHGPWLTNPTYTGMTVSFVSRANCAAAIEWRVKGTEKWTRRWDMTYGMLDYTKTVHSFHLKNLQPATEYEYRFAVASSRYQTAYCDTVVGTQVWSFKTLDPKRDAYKVFVTTDVHGASHFYLDYQYERANAKEADMYFFLGDNVEDHMNQPEFYITRGFLDPVVRLWGSYKPTIFLRGNHDSWGFHAADGWATWYAKPDPERGYFTVRQGGALFICMELPAEYTLREPGKQAEMDYANEELEWLKQLKTTDEWKSATWRIACCHYGTRCGSGSGFKLMCQVFGETLNDPKDPIDLLLCGDEHTYARNDPHTDKLIRSTKYDSPKFKMPKYPNVDARWNFTEVCLESTGTAIIEFKDKTLDFTAVDIHQKNQPPLDHFTLKK